MDAARATLAAVGLTMNDLAKAKIKAKKGPQHIGGRPYQHPTGKTLVWKSKGQKPGWVRELELSGQAVIEIVVK